MRWWRNFTRKWRIIWNDWNRSPKDEVKAIWKGLDKADDDLEKSEALDELKELNDKIKMKIYWINWISLNRKVKKQYGIWEQLVELDQEILCRKEGKDN
jgi:hypothetical protein